MSFCNKYHSEDECWKKHPNKAPQRQPLPSNMSSQNKEETQQAVKMVNMFDSLLQEGYHPVQNIDILRDRRVSEPNQQFIKQQASRYQSESKS